MHEKNPNAKVGVKIRKMHSYLRLVHNPWSADIFGRILKRLSIFWKLKLFFCTGVSEFLRVTFIWCCGLRCHVIYTRIKINVGGCCTLQHDSGTSI